MTKIEIYSQRYAYKTIVTFNAILFTSAFTLAIEIGGFAVFLDIKTWIWLLAAAIVSFIIQYGFYLKFTRGRKIEMDNSGINIGKSYIGPLNSPPTSYQFPKYNPSDRVVAWKNITSISLSKLGLSWVKGYPGYFLIITTSNSNSFAIEMDKNMAEKSKKAIITLGYAPLLIDNVFDENSANKPL